MARNNIKLLTREQLEAFKERYEFISDTTSVVVKVNGYKRETRHPKNQPFHINAKNIRKLIFNVNAITIWDELGPRKYNLVEIQNAVNALTISYQHITTKNVLQMLVKINERMREN